MFRFVSRIAGFCLLAAAVVALVIDGTRSIAAEEILLTPLGTTAFWLFPSKFPILQPAIERHVHPWLWDPVLVDLFLLPTALVLGVLGVVIFGLSLRRERPSGESPIAP